MIIFDEVTEFTPEQLKEWRERREQLPSPGVKGAVWTIETDKRLPPEKVAEMMIYLANNMRKNDD